MTTAVLPRRLADSAVGDRALEATARLWFLTAVAGQLVFAFAVASYYLSAVVRGNLLAWNRFMMRGFIHGDGAGNAAVAVHVASAVLITLSGALQLVPQLRLRAPAFHRWNGRVYLLAALSVTAAGVYLTWFRGQVGHLPERMGSMLNATLIWVCAAMALRTALSRDFRTHRRWALRLFLVVSASWFFRVAFLFTMIVFGPVGLDTKTFEGPLLVTLSFSQTLLPLAVVELYFRAQRGGNGARLAMAGGLAALTLAMGVGIFGATMAFWVPQVKAAYDRRPSLVDTLTATLDRQGLDAAVRQYRAIKAAAPAGYDLGEKPLNRLGYALLRARRTDEAVRIFELNAEAFPRSVNVLDSLAEGYEAKGDTARAIASYRRLLDLEPGNRGAQRALQKLTR